jgi:glucan phosphoethanolaminetransferase (alkaline phosphatase superfamily)
MIIIFAVLLIIVIVIIFLIASLKGEVLTMNKLRNIYLYLVSFVSLMMIIGGLIFTVQNITDVIYPTNTYYEPYPVDKGNTLTEEEKKLNEENKKKYDENRRMDSRKSVAKSVAVVVVALPVFAYHWRKIEKEKKEVV